MGDIFAAGGEGYGHALCPVGVCEGRRSGPVFTGRGDATVYVQEAVSLKILR